MKRSGIDTTMVDWRSLHGDAFEGARVLVTGAAGFIGSHLVEALAALGAKVIALDDLSGGDWANLARLDSGVEKITGSILDEKLLEGATTGCKWVFHQAALGSVPRSVKEPRLYHGVNVGGTLNVLEAARRAGVQRVMFAASSSAYGDPPVEGAKVETMPSLPRSPYAATKLAGEHLVRSWFHSYGLDGVALRYFNIFGPRQNANSAYAAVIAAFAKALAAGERAVIYGDGKQSRDFTYVANAVHANLLAARTQGELGGEVINVACGASATVNELHDAMAARWPRKGARAEYQPFRAGDVMHSLAEIGRARKLLGYEVIVPFERGLASTTDWYKKEMAAK
jgi:UDP-glucose 4-epimerase